MGVLSHSLRKLFTGQGVRPGVAPLCTFLLPTPTMRSGGDSDEVSEKEEKTNHAVLGGTNQRAHAARPTAD